jgi:hypothetical protein
MTDLNSQLVAQSAAATAAITDVRSALATQAGYAEVSYSLRLTASEDDIAFFEAYATNDPEGAGSVLRFGAGSIEFYGDWFSIFAEGVEITGDLIVGGYLVKQFDEAPENVDVSTATWNVVASHTFSPSADRAEVLASFRAIGAAGDGDIKYKWRVTLSYQFGGQQIDTLYPGEITQTAHDELTPDYPGEPSALGFYTGTFLTVGDPATARIEVFGVNAKTLTIKNITLAVREVHVNTGGAT